MKKISIIILLCLIMSITVSCGKDNDVKDTHNTSNDNLNSEIENLNSQVAELQSQINELTSDPYNETVDEMYYEFELDGEMLVTAGSTKCPELIEIPVKDSLAFIDIKLTNNRTITLTVPYYSNNNSLPNFYVEYRKLNVHNVKGINNIKIDLNDQENRPKIGLTERRINGNNYYFICLEDLRNILDS